MLQRAHLVGSCSTVASAADGSEWRSASPGSSPAGPASKLDSCTDWGLYGDAEYWSCPARSTTSAQRE